MFSIDGKLFKTLIKAGDFLILGVLLVVCSLPVVTIGASLTSAFYVGLKLVRDEEGYVVRGFFKSFKSNFKQSLVLELIIAVIGIFLIQDIRICNMYAANGSTIANMAMYAFVGLFLVLVGVTVYAFPLLAKFDNTSINTLKNAMLICMHHLAQTFVMLLATCMLTVFTIKYFTAAIITIPVILYVDSYILARVFKIYADQSNN